MNSEATPLRVIIVDDHPIVRDGLRSLLSSIDDIELVGEAGTGEDAITLVDAIKPDVVIMDIEMPGMNGVDALRGIRAIDAAIPVIMVTGSESTRLAGDVIKGGAFSYLPKPVRLQYLEHLAASVLQP